jgi:hypothetical protein
VLVFGFFQHAFTLTRRFFLHGSMQVVWRKTHIPHANRQRKTNKNQNRNQNPNRLVAATKNFSPHKERE